MLIHKTNIYGASARAWAAAAATTAGRDSAVVGSLEAEAPLEASREWGWRQGAVQRPAGSTATKSTLPQMSALGLRPLAPVYLLTSFFKINHKSLPQKHNGQNFSAGAKRKQSISFHALVWTF
jgi:hypothetical protein